MPLTPKAEEAIARLAKITVEKGWDPAQVIMNLLESVRLLNALEPEMRQQVLAELRRRLGDGA